jgi:hypothetical protein
MRCSRSRLLHIALVCLIFSSRAIAGEVCQKSLDDLGSLTVSEVRIETLLNLPSARLDKIFFGPLNRRLDELSQTLTIKPGQRFSRQAYNAGRREVFAMLGPSQLGPLERIRIEVVVPAVEDCPAGKVAVVYRILTTQPSFYLVQDVASTADRISRELLPETLAPSQKPYSIQPLMGYNASRSLFGGVAATLDFGTSFLKEARVDISGSPGNLVAGLALSGQGSLDSAVLNYVDWHVQYRYSDIPVSDSGTTLRQGALSALFLGTSRPVASGALQFRYGGSVGGGNCQAIQTSAMPIQGATDTSCGALKLYVGSAFARGRQQGAASYGLQLGTLPGSLHYGYTKQLVDFKYNVRFLPRVHSPIRVETAFNAGWIGSPPTQVPAAELFYGGNVSPKFIQADTWSILAGPHLRSFPQYSFNTVTSTSVFNATRFLSANLTFAPTIWKYPAVPDELLREPDLRTALAFQLSTAKEAFLDDCAAQSKPFVDVVRQVKRLGPVLRGISEWRAVLHSHDSELPDSVASALSDTDDAFETLLEKTADVLRNPKIGTSIVKVRQMSSDDPEKSQITQLELAADTLADSLADTPFSAQITAIKSSATQLNDIRVSLASAYAKVVALQTPNLSNYDAVIRQFPVLRAALETMTAPLQKISEATDENVSFSRDNAESFLKESLRMLTAAEQESGDKLYGDMEGLVLHWGETVPAPADSLIQEVQRLQSDLKRAGLNEEAASFTAPLEELSKTNKRLISQFRAVPPPPTEVCAFGESTSVVRTVDATFRELNLFQLTPIWMLDFAQLSTPSLGSTGLRFGTGPGIRLSLATLDVTVGYAFNVSPKQGEGRGAFFFSLDVTDLFR